jgi:S1-C subfamily serine protease
LSTRGAKEAKLFKAVSPSVVLIVTDDGLGSGSVVGPGKILTNWHVVAGQKEVGVIFKPGDEGEKPTKADAVKGTVTSVDETTDLALVEYRPEVRTAKPIELGSSAEIEAGADVNAIGHPTGEAWTFTRGVISQFRKGYEWKTEAGVVHRADVIQTQTPINPGNSGGPLLTDSGHLIGVNAFKASGEALNFAVSVADVRRFIAAPPKRPAQSESKKECVPKVIYEGRSNDNTSYVRAMDVFCTGKTNAVLTIPDDQGKAIRLALDTTGSGKPDVWVYDVNRDGKWDYSLHSSSDGKIDLIGYHPDGDILPSRVEPYHGQPTPWAY